MTSTQQPQPSVIPASPASLTVGDAFGLFFEQSVHACYVYDAATLRFLAVNRAAVERYGYSREEFERLTVVDIRPPEDVPEFLASLHTLGTGMRRLGRFRHRSRDGRTIPVEITTNEVMVDGRRARLVEARDITEQVRAESALRGVELRFQTVVENLHEGLLIIDFDCVVQYANPKLEEVLGIPRQQLIGKNLHPFMSEARRERLALTLQERRAGKSETYLDQVVRPDGSRVWVEVHAAPFRDPDGNIAGIVSAFIDITERKRADDEIRRSLSLLRATLESTADGILVVNNQGGVESWNTRFLELWRIPPALAEQRNDKELLEYVVAQLLDPRAFLERVTELYASDEVSFDIVEFKDGRVLERYSQPQSLDDRRIGRVWSFRDITERRRAEASMLQAQKLEALGLLAGGMAHDFNNVLTAILGCAELGIEAARGNAAVITELEEIRRAAMNASSLTRQLLLFSRKRERQLVPIPLNDAIRASERMLRRLVPENMTLRLSLGEALGSVVADPGELEQVLVNLVLNARDACRDGSTITVMTSRRQRDEPAASVAPGETGALLVLAVADTGVGMSPSVRERMFEPFFTTKGAGRGTGLGLAAVLAIVSRAGGTINVESHEGHGTTVEIVLPEVFAASSAAIGSESAVPAAAPSRESAILVVEDAPTLRRSTRRILEQAGYRVYDATDGVDALDVLRREGAHQFALVLSDVVMPRMGGRELAAAVRREWPSLAILLMTGYDDGRVPAQAAAERIPIVEKPFSIAELLDAVGAMIAGADR